MARIITRFVWLPWTMNPPIITLSPVCTKARVEMLPSCASTGGGCAQYLPPVLKETKKPDPPHTIISLPVQTAVCPVRAVGALVVLVSIQLSVLGLYLTPPFVRHKIDGHPTPPQTIISLP